MNRGLDIVRRVVGQRNSPALTGERSVPRNYAAFQKHTYEN